MTHSSKLSQKNMVLSSASRAYDAPVRYIQGCGEIRNLFEYGSRYGKKFLIIIDAGIEEIALKLLTSIERRYGCEYETAVSSAETCMEEVERLKIICTDNSCDAVIGIGGGKVIDTAKLVSDEAGVPRIIVPTIASNDAPFANWAAVYTSSGVHITGRATARATELVLVDSKVIADAPARLFSAGIGDAIATWYESEAVRLSSSPNCVGRGYLSTITSDAVCRACRDVLLSEGKNALDMVKQHKVNKSVEDVIEANVLMSGLGFINGGLAGAHGLHSGFSEIKGSGKYLHGEKVAFGLLCQMMLEGKDLNEIKEMAGFLISVDLPVTLEQIGIEPTDDNLDTVINHTLYKNPLIHHEPGDPSYDEVKKAVLDADKLGKQLLKNL